MEGALLIFVRKITPRISYTFSLFFDSIIITPHRITQSIEEYKSYSGPKFCYADAPTDAGLFFCASGLLSETGLPEQNITVDEWNGLKIFYKVNKGSLPFDMFSASFFMVSRYEEYTTQGRDGHNRFRAEDSLAFKNEFTDKPVVNLWAKELKKILEEKYPALQIKTTQYTFTPTLDIDVAYAHKGRNFKVTLGSYLFALSKLDIATMGDKTLTLLGLKKDKYDTYDYQESIFKKYNLRPIYFFLAAKRGKHDKNIPTDGARFTNLVKKVFSFAAVGIHPSYQSQSKPEIVKTEIERVEKSLKEKTTKSRQHFLRILLPETYRTLAQLGITDDYSLAYASCPGFRAGICTPFFFYDLPKEEALPVKIHSTVIMEGTFREYMRLTPDDAILFAKKLITEVKNCNGEFICIWHNHSIGETSSWKGWRRVFESMIENAL
jgi:hypothetical protein